MKYKATASEKAEREKRWTVRRILASGAVEPRGQSGRLPGLRLERHCSQFI